MHDNKNLWFSDRVFKKMRESRDARKEELSAAVDDAAAVILESKGKEASVRKNASVEPNFSVSVVTISVTAILLLVSLSVILIYLL